MKRIFNILLCVTLLALTGCTEEKFINNDDLVIPINENYSISAITEEFEYQTGLLENGVSKDSTVKSYIRTNLKYQKNTEDLITLEDVLESSNEIKELRLEENLDFLEKSKDEVFGSKEYRSGDKDILSFDQMHDYGKQTNAKQILTKEEAVEDIETLDLLFRSFYGAYKVIGKDRFDNSYQKALAAVEDIETISRKDLMHIIYQSYDAIQDGHFSWDGQYNYWKSKGFIDYSTDGYYNDDFYYLKDETGYYLKDYSPKTYLESVNGDSNLDEYMNYSITSSGEIAYIISYLELESKGNHEIIIKLAGEEYIIVMTQMNGAINYDSDYSFTLENDYPVVKLKAYYGSHIPFDDYFELGSHLQNQNVIIKDTRNNRGGTPENVTDFLDNLYPGLNSSDGWVKGGNNNTENGFYYFCNPYESIYNNEDNLLINLCDAKAGSGGDDIAIQMDRLKNALNVGEPTMGCLLSGGGQELYLPNSGISVRVERCLLVIQEDFLEPDGRGHLPDLWVPSIEALDKTIKMLEYYEVEASPTASNLVDMYGEGNNKVNRVIIEEEKIDSFSYELYPNGFVKEGYLYLSVEVKELNSSGEENEIYPLLYYKISEEDLKNNQYNYYEETINGVTLRFRIIENE